MNDGFFPNGSGLFGENLFVLQDEGRRTDICGLQVSDALNKTANRLYEATGFFRREGGEPSFEVRMMTGE